MKGYLFATAGPRDESLPLRVAIVGVAQNQPRIVRVEGWAYFQWIQCREGIGEINIDGQRFLIGPGQGVLLFPESNHEYHPVQIPWIMDWVSFDGPMAREALVCIQIANSQVLNISESQSPLNKIIHIYETLLENTPHSNVDCSGYLYGLLMDIFYLSSPTTFNSKQQKYELLSPVFDYIESHYNEPFTLRDLAGQLGISQQYLCQLFRQTMGIRPFEYVNRVKIRHAKEMIIRDAMKGIQSVAREVGYDNYGYFLRTFKELEDITPSEFRQRHQLSSPALIPYE